MDDIKTWLEVTRAKGTAYSDAVECPQRGGRYGEAYVQSVSGSKVHALSDEGSYFIQKNATTGTGIASTAAVTAYDATKPFLYLYNSATASEGTRIYLDYLKLQVTSAGTNGTALWYDMVLDNIARYTSGGTASTFINPNMDSSATQSATGYAGALVAPAASSDVRKVCGGAIRLVIPVVGDQYLFNFGSPSCTGSSLALAGTAITSFVSPAPPIVVGPGDSFLVYLWLPSQDGASSYEYELGFWQR